MPISYDNYMKLDFDEVDIKILEILRLDGRASQAMIAKEVNLSPPAVGERIKKLEQTGVITGYRAILNPNAFGLDICAYVSIIPQPRHPVTNLVENLEKLQEVEEFHAIAGNYSYLIKVRVSSTEELDNFLDKLFMLDGVERTQTTMVLKTNVDRPMPLRF